MLPLSAVAAGQCMRGEWGLPGRWLSVPNPDITAHGRYRNLAVQRMRLHKSGQWDEVCVASVGRSRAAQRIRGE
jgi:hypothetical protein